MIRNLFILIVLILTTSITFADSDDIFDVIAGGAEEYEFVRYSPEEIQLKIKEDMLVACENGLCTIFGISNSGYGEFEIKFDVGYGAATTASDGVTTSAAPSPFVGLTLSYTYHGKCQQVIQVPRSIYIAINTYMYSLITENGEPQRTMMPATEAMLVFYSTIMNKATGCNN